MSIILRNLGSKIVTRGLGPADDLPLDKFCIKQKINIHNHIYEEKEYYPLTGTFNNIEGWKWNKNLPQDLSDVRERINNSLGGYLYNLEEGTIKNDWKGSVVDGIAFLDILEVQYKTKIKKWLPVIKTGNYTIYNYIKKLYSNYSSSEIYNSLTNENGLYKKQIATEALEASINLVVFKRDKSFINIPYKTFENANDISSIEDNQYYLDRDENDDLFVYTNKDYSFQIGKETSILEEITCLNEYLGLGRYSRAIAYLEYFPCFNLTLKSIYPDNSIIDWIQVDSFVNSRDGDNHYILESHTGKIVFNTYNEQKDVCYLQNIVGNKLLTFNEIKNHPEEGVLLINNTLEVEYYSKGKYHFYLKQNNLNNIPASKSRVVLISRPRSLKEGEELYANYSVAPRIDYEVYEKDRIGNVNLKPYTKEDSNGVLQISAIEKHVSKLSLTSDLSNIVGNLYGPLYMQGVATLIFATAYNNLDATVEDIKVTFTADEGLFESEALEITKITNLEGIAQTSYSYPYKHNGLSHFSNVEYIRDNSYFELPDMPLGLTLQDISVFQVLKTDPFYGSYGLFLNVTEQEIQGGFLVLSVHKTIEDPYEYFAYDVNQESSSSAILENYCNGDDKTVRNYGFATLFNNNNLRSFDGDQTVIIHKIVDNKIYLFLTGAIKTFLGVGSSSYSPASGISIFKRNGIKWNSNDYLANEQEALERIIYKYDEEEEEYTKLLPSRIVGNRIYFDNIRLPKGDLNNRFNLIAGYKIFYPKTIKLRAFCNDPATGRTIFSNFLKIKVDFPEYLKSANGFRIKNELTEESSGLGGANFITINPKNIYQINLMIEN